MQLKGLPRPAFDRRQRHNRQSRAAGAMRITPSKPSARMRI
jgi:hypothetical protein